MRRNARERGASTLLVGLVVFVLAVVGIGGAAIGRVVAARGDAQRAADAAAVGIAELVRDHGPGASPTAEIAEASRNSRTLGISLSDRVYDKWQPRVAGNLFVTTTASITVPVPRFVQSSGVKTITVSSTAAIGEWVQPETLWMPAKLMFVLDFSGSMFAKLPGGSQTAIDDLKSSIKEIIGYHLPIQYSAVMFDDAVIGKEPFQDPAGGDTAQKIVDLLNTVQGGGGTMTGLGLQTAHDLIQKEDDDVGPGGGFHVLLVSDGEPSDGNASYAQADRLRNDFANHVPPLTMWAIHIDWSGGTNTGLSGFMQDMTGTRDHHPDPSLYYRVLSKDDMGPAMAKLIASIGCPVGPLDPAQIESPRRMRVFLRDKNGFEVALDEKNDPNIDDLLHKKSYRWDDRKVMIYPTIPVCEDLSGKKLAVVVRYNRPHLVR